MNIRATPDFWAKLRVRLKMNVPRRSLRIAEDAEVKGC